jgi:hypothetical protein
MAKIYIITKAEKMGGYIGIAKGPRNESRIEVDVSIPESGNGFDAYVHGQLGSRADSAHLAEL